jgi:PTH2 family peptidyl-tRNA hydrolase
MAAQAAHASTKVILDAMFKGSTVWTLRIDILSDAFVHWLKDEFTKIVVGVETAEELLEIVDRAAKQNIPHSVIIDSGHTEFHGAPTLTCGAIGPAASTELDPLTGHLELM